MTTKSRTPRVVAIIQFRMGSSRLPGKSMMDLAGAPLINRLLERVHRVKSMDEVIVATTNKCEDDVIWESCQDLGVSCYRGSENDLVDRYYKAAKFYSADVIVRIPGDNPVPEPAEIDRIVAYHIASDNDMSSNYQNVSDSPVVKENGYPDGIGAEVYSMHAFEIVWKTAAKSRNREHPHSTFFENPDKFKVGTIECPIEFKRPDIVLDINTKDEYNFVSQLYEYLYQRDPEFSIMDVIDWYDTVYKKA